MPGLYNLISPKNLKEYAKKTGIDGKNPPDLREFKKLIKKKSRILEVGCGTGRLGKHLIFSHEYVGIDNHKPYVHEFKKELKQKGVKNVDKKVLLRSFNQFHGKHFDAILFPWSIIADFNKKKQIEMIKKAKNMLNKRGIILLDNPSKKTPYNKVPGYKPTKFYFKGWKERSLKIGFSKVKRKLYRTNNGKEREITILGK